MIGIQTFYYMDNYGAVLQCYALERYLELNNADVCVIKFVSPYMRPLRSRLKRIFLSTEQQRKFKSFRDKFLKVKNLSYYDIIVIGSDQVWNPEITGYDTRWYSPNIDYGNVVAYAASIGKKKLSLSETEYFESAREILTSYRAIGIREQDGKEIMENVGICSSVVCDPTLLLFDRKVEYEKLIEKCKPLVHEEYIFVYSLEASCYLDNAIQYAKDKFGVKVVAVHPVNIRLCKCDEFLENVGVEEFLYLIKNSKIVITNSYHGMIFSLVFGKGILTIPHSQLSSRQEQLNSLLNTRIELIEENLYQIKEGKIDGDLKNFIEISKDFIAKEILSDITS